jgi:hypothetical protein
VIAVALVAVLSIAAGLLLAIPRGGAAARPSSGSVAEDQQIRAVWRSAPANQLMPGTLTREGTETYVRVGVDPAEGCGALPAKFAAALAPATCSRVVTATYVDRTQEVTATVGIVVTAGSPDARRKLYQTWTADSFATQYSMMPDAYPVPGTAAANFKDPQRVVWESQISTDGTYIVYAVAGFTDGRVGSTAAALAAGTGSALNNDSPPVEVAADLPSAIQNILSTKENAVSGGSS